LPGLGAWWWMSRVKARMEREEIVREVLISADEARDILAKERAELLLQQQVPQVEHVGSKA
jgi:hypothetical protein